MRRSQLVRPHSGLVSLCRLLALLYTPMLIGGCSSEAGLLVDIGTWPDGAEVLRVSSTVDGVPGSDLLIEKGQTRFVVLVPSNHNGNLHLDLAGIDAGDCRVAFGQLDRWVGPGLRSVQEVSAVVSPANPTLCRLTVKVAAGMVTSEPPGLMCQATSSPCFADFQIGTQIKLSAAFDASTAAQLGTWTEGCAGIGDCSLVLDRSRTAAVSLQPRQCSPQGFCPVLFDQQEPSLLAADAAGRVWLKNKAGQMLHCGDGGCDVFSLQTDDYWYARGQRAPQLSPGSADEVWTTGAAGTIIRCSGAGCTPMASGSTQDFNGLSASDRGEAWAVGNQGRIVRCSNSGCTAVPSGTTNDLMDVRAGSDGTVWSVGTQGTVLRCGGTSCNALFSGTTSDLTQVEATADGGAWVLSSQGSLLMHCSGDVCIQVPMNNTATLNKLRVSSSGDAWLVGNQGSVLHCSGVSCLRLGTDAQADLLEVVTNGSGEAWAMGSQSLLHCAGDRCAAVSLPAGLSNRFNNLALSSGGQAWIAGAGGLVLRCNAQSCAAVKTASTNKLGAIVAAAGGEMWIGDYAAGTLRCLGDSCATTIPASLGAITRVYPGAANEAWVLGENIVRCKNGVCQTLYTTFNESLAAMAVASSGEAWAVGARKSGTGATASLVLRCAGASCTRVSCDSPQSLTAASVNPAGELWAVGQRGAVVRCRGGSCDTIPSGIAGDLTDVVAGSGGTAWVAGGNLWTCSTTGCVATIGAPFTRFLAIDMAGFLWSEGDYGTVFGSCAGPSCPIKSTCGGGNPVSALQKRLVAAAGTGAWVLNYDLTYPTALGNARVCRCGTTGCSAFAIPQLPGVPQLLTVADIAVGPSGELWAVGALGPQPSKLVRCEGAGCTLVPVAGTPALTTLGAGPGGELWVATASGSLLHRMP